MRRFIPLLLIFMICAMPLFASVRAEKAGEMKARAVRTMNELGYSHEETLGIMKQISESGLSGEKLENMYRWVARMEHRIALENFAETVENRIKAEKREKTAHMRKVKVRAMLKKKTEGNRPE